MVDMKINKPLRLLSAFWPGHAECQGRSSDDWRCGTKTNCGDYQWDLERKQKKENASAWIETGMSILGVCMQIQHSKTSTLSARKEPTIALKLHPLKSSSAQTCWKEHYIRDNSNCKSTHTCQQCGATTKYEWREEPYRMLQTLIQEKRPERMFFARELTDCWIDFVSDLATVKKRKKKWQNTDSEQETFLLKHQYWATRKLTFQLLKEDSNGLALVHTGRKKGAGFNTMWNKAKPVRHNTYNYIFSFRGLLIRIAAILMHDQSHDWWLVWLCKQTQTEIISEAYPHLLAHLTLPQLLVQFGPSPWADIENKGTGRQQKQQNEMNSRPGWRRKNENCRTQ